MSAFLEAQALADQPIEAATASEVIREEYPDADGPGSLFTEI